MSCPPAVSLTVSLMAPETVPVCTVGAVEKALVWPAGIVKFSVLPPLENWMAGSSAALTASGMNSRVREPEIGIE